MAAIMNFPSSVTKSLLRLDRLDMAAKTNRLFGMPLTELMDPFNAQGKGRTLHLLALRAVQPRVAANA